MSNGKFFQNKRMLIIFILVGLMGCASFIVGAIITLKNQGDSILAVIEDFTDREKPVTTSQADTPEFQLSNTLDAQFQAPHESDLTISVQPTLVLSPTISPSVTSSPVPTYTMTMTPSPLPTREPAYDWISEIVRSEQSVGFFTSLAFDQDDGIYVSFFQDDLDLLWLGTKSTGQWEFTNVMGGPGSGFNNSLDIDSKGNPHLAYRVGGSENNPEVKYVLWTGSDWKLIRVYGSYAANTDVSLALDNEDNPHIVYLDGYSYNLIYAYFSNKTGWIFQTIGASNENCKSIPIYIDEGGNPHVSYQTSKGGLKYAVLEDGTWRTFDVDTNNGAGIYSSVVTDSEGKPNIAFYDGSSGELKYAYLDDGWIISTVDESGDVGQYPSIEISNNNNIFISYYDVTNSALKFAHYRERVWDLYVVDDNGDVGQMSSLSINSMGIPYISYFDATNQDLKIAFPFKRNP